ncbi:hypothetical protein TNCV_2460681 [Trichonephila clavipes]|nr:hypothetical protein TNCV_2460681 [Trichonephila clavipes]
MFRDEVPKRFRDSVLDWIGMAYYSPWIGYVGLVLWLPRSPDFTQMDFSSMEKSQGVNVLRCSDCINGLSCSSACFCTSVDTTLL